MYISFKLKSNILHCRLKSSVPDWISGLTGLQNAPHYISVSSTVHQTGLHIRIYSGWSSECTYLSNSSQTFYIVVSSPVSQTGVQA